MTPERWKYLKALRPPEPRYLHISARAGMIPNPEGANLPWIPYVEPGTTYNIGRNAAKREARNDR